MLLGWTVRRLRYEGRIFVEMVWVDWKDFVVNIISLSRFRLPFLVVTCKY